MKSLKLLIFIAFVSALTFAQTTSSNGPDYQLPGAQYFGMTSYNQGAVVTQPTVLTGANNNVVPTVCRTWDGNGLNLDVMATSRGTYNWSVLDAFMNKCAAVGSRTIFTYGLIPSWATGTGTTQCHNGGHNGACDPPTDWNTVAACQGSLAGTTTDNCRVREMIKDLLLHATANGTPLAFLELGNETNFCLSQGTEATCHSTTDVEFNGTVAQYRAITNAIISTARAVQPGIVIIGPAVASMNAQACGTVGVGQSWANLYYAAPAPAVDLIGFHGYTSSFGAGGGTNAENIDAMIGTFIDVTDASGTTHTTCPNVAAVYNGGTIPLADTEDSWGNDVMAGVHVVSVARSANTTTVITSPASGITTGSTVVLSQVDGCATGAPWNGTFTNATVSGTSITYANTGTSQATCNPTNNTSIIGQQYLQTQADFLARRMLIEYSWGVKYKVWYTFYQTTTGWGNLCGAYNSSGCQDSRPARIAYGELYKWIASITPSAQCSKSGTRWTCDYTRKDGYQSEAVWNTAGSSSYTYPAIYKQSRGLTGAPVTPLATSSLTISTTPLLLEVYPDRTKIDLGKQKGIVPVLNGGSGNGGETSVSTSPGDIQFGTVKTGTGSPLRSVAISNTGSNPITIGTLTITGTGAAHFTTSNICAGEVLDAGATCVEQVQYNPVSAVSEAATLTVTSSAPVNPVDPLVITLAGTGTGAVTFPLTVNCGGLGSGTIQSGETPPLINATCNNGSISGVFTNNYATGAIAVLTATAANGSTFNTFAGCSITTSPGSCTVSAATTVNAQFDVTPSSFLLSVVGGGQGTGRADSDLSDVNTGNRIGCTSTAGVLTPGQKCTGTFHQGDVVTLTATPSLSGVGTCTGAACTFTSWAGATNCGTALACVITIGGPQTVTMNFAAPNAGAPPALVQPIGGGTGGTNNVTGNFSQAQSAGDTNIVYVEWGDATTTVSSVTDTKGNTYTQATSPACSPKVGTGLSMALYYAKNILAAAAGANTVTVALSASPSYRAILAEEYSGLDTTAPLDACNGGTGTGTAISSGSFTSTVANDLLTGGDAVAFHISANSPNFTQEILFGGNTFEDRFGVAAAAYTFAPTHSNSQPWAAIGAAWKSAGGSGTGNFVLNVNCGGTGSGTVSSNGSSLSCAGGVPVSGGISLSVPQNSTPTILAAPNSGSVFSTYSGGGGCGISASCTTTPIVGTTTITANFAVNSAGVQNYYINKSTGSDSNSGLCAVAGTPSGCTGPWNTIGKAASTSLVLGANGTVVNVTAGTYSECITTNQSGTASQRIRYLSTTQFGAKVTCNGSSNPSGQLAVWANGTGSNTRTADYVDISGFEITATTPANRCMGIVSMGAFALIQGNYVHDILGVGNTTCQGGGGAGIDFFNNGNPPTVAHDSIAENNIIDHIGGGNSGDGTTCANVHGIYLASPRQTARNNIISRACSWGIHMFHDTYQDVIANNTIISNYNGGILVSASDGFTNDNTTVINNVVANNGGNEGGIEERYGATGPNSVYRNNLLWGNANFAFNFVNGSRTTSGNTCGAAGTGCNNVASLSNALFTSYTGNSKTGNYAAASSSNALVNTGANGPCAASPGISPCVPPKAIDGTPRPVGIAFDRGAYEQ